MNFFFFVICSLSRSSCRLSAVDERSRRAVAPRSASWSNSRAGATPRLAGERMRPPKGVVRVESICGVVRKDTIDCRNHSRACLAGIEKHCRSRFDRIALKRNRARTRLFCPAAVSRVFALVFKTPLGGCSRESSFAALLRVPIVMGPNGPFARVKTGSDAGVGGVDCQSKVLRTGEAVSAHARPPQPSR